MVSFIAIGIKKIEVFFPHCRLLLLVDSLIWKTTPTKIAFLQWNIRLWINCRYYIRCYYGIIKTGGLLCMSSLHLINLSRSSLFLSHYWFSLKKSPCRLTCFFHLPVSLLSSSSLSSYCNASLMRWVAVLCAFASKVSPNGPESLYFVS